MKKIKLRTNLFNGNEKITSAGILRLVCGNSPQRPLSIEEIRRRVRILDALDDATKPGDDGTFSEVLSLEDEDHKALCAAIEGFPWVNASKGLLTIIDDVLQAETAKASPMKVVKE